ncbi:hypothetical protein BPOR_0513g00070 [Botrytis porri]|uniref:C3H1-type domain-containing protein n=1 Tax=Botrytis porri TaxID=87229 RepID=A0A4Z1KFS7_9HELO|nr:hypothetical protein BPOR_0513g00070 [Botrytis porri]
MGICIYYPIGRCVAGEQCHNKHTGPYQPYPCKNFIYNGTCKWGLECRFGHPATVLAENPEPIRPACKNFLSRRGCNNGSKCLSYHPVPTEKVAPSATSTLQQPQSTKATPEILKTTQTVTIKSSKAKPANTTVAPLMNFRSARIRPQKPKVILTTPNVSKAYGSTNVELSMDKPASKIIMQTSPKEFGVITQALPVAESITTTPIVSETATAANVELSEEKPASTTATQSKDSSATTAILQAQVTMGTPAVSSTANAIDMDSSYEKPADKIPAPSIDPVSYEIALSPTELTIISSGTSNTGATNTDSSNDQPDGTVTTPSMSPDTTPRTPSFQVLTPASTNVGNADDIGYVSSTDTIPMSDSSEEVRSATRSPSPTDDAHDASMSTVPDDSSTPVKTTPAASTDATKLSNVLACESTTPLIIASDFKNARPVSALQPVDLGTPNDPFDQSVVEGPINGTDNTMPPKIPVEALTAISHTASTKSAVDPEQASVVQPTDPVLPPNELSNQTTTVAPPEDKRLSVMEPVTTDYRSATNTLSRVVVDWSATLEHCNLDLSGPGIYERQISHTEVLFIWPQEWNVPANDMINTLMHIASTWGELSPYQPIHRNMGSWHSLQITFRHRHEAAAAAAAINGHLITAVNA